MGFSGGDGGGGGGDLRGVTREERNRGSEYAIFC
jgi:hypothetical protein